MAVLSVKNLRVAYAGKAAVSGVSFELEEGDYFYLVGPNGGGKSSLVKAVLGLAEITQGEVVWGVDREQIAYLPQTETVPRDFPATVREIVLSGARRRLFATRADRAAAEESMALLGITALADVRAGELSGGQRKRMFFARALSRKPRLLVLDEPFAGLDGEIAQSLHALLDAQNAQGVTILMVSHDLGDVRKRAKHVAELDGTLRYCGALK